jgi:HK97 family phage major capsid protein
MTYSGAVRADQAAAWLPEDFGKLLSLEVQSKSVAAQVSNVFKTDKAKANFPIWNGGVTTAFYDELDEITPSNGDTGEVVIEPVKAAGLHLSSSELFDDADPDIASQIGKALANQIAESYDAALFANTTAKGFDGLLSLASTAVDTGASLSNLDNFVSGRYAAEAHGAKLTHWLMSPTTAETLSLLKRQSGSNESLIQFVEDGIAFAGLPVITSIHVDANTFAWGIDKTQQRFVVRSGTKVERFPSVTNDGQWVRGIMRAAWGTLNPAGIVRLYDAA